MRVRSLASWLVALVGAAGVAVTQPRAKAEYAELGETTDVFALPSGEHLMLMSLGYRSALADLLFGHTLVDAGIHFTQHTAFEHLDRRLDAIVTLEPRFRDVYMYADVLLTLSTAKVPAQNYRIARDLLERGNRAFPDDGPLWVNAGEFLLYLAPGHLPPNENVDEWKLAGAEMIAHGCAAWPPGGGIPRGCLIASNSLDRAGQVDAAVNLLQRMLALSDDPESRAQAENQLNELLGYRRAEEMREAARKFVSLQSSDLPLASRAAYQMMSPPFDAARCLGRREPPRESGCATSFRAWDELNSAP